MKEIFDNYKGFGGLKSLVDVGGGTGAVVDMIVSKYPTIKCINFDLPHVIEDAPPYPGTNLQLKNVTYINFSLISSHSCIKQVEPVCFKLFCVISTAPSIRPNWTSVTFLFLVFSGVEHVGGDMFVSVPKADAIFMKVCCYLQPFILSAYCISNICFPDDEFLWKKKKKNQALKAK